MNKAGRIAGDRHLVQLVVSPMSGVSRVRSDNLEIIIFVDRLMAC